MHLARVILVVLVAFGLLLGAPAGAGAVEAGEPEMIDDPIAAMEPEIHQPEPVAEPAGEDVTAAANAPKVAADGGMAEMSTVAPSTPVATGAGQLPFTGTDSRDVVLLFYVGSLLVSCGFLAIAATSAPRRDI